jgi:ketosteroid isomerase-like protein
MLLRDHEAEAEIERIERIFADPNFDLEECYRYIDSDEFVGFDFMPPTVVGREGWKAHVGALVGSVPKIDARIVRLEVRAGSDFGFANSILHFEAYDEAGNATFAGDLRQTICYRKKDGRWYQVSQHASVPVDMASGQPVFKNSW